MGRGKLHPERPTRLHPPVSRYRKAGKSRREPFPVPRHRGRGPKGPAVPAAGLDRQRDAGQPSGGELEGGPVPPPAVAPASSRAPPCTAVAAETP